MSFDASKVFIVRLVSNEELLGLVIDNPDNSLKVEVPYQIGFRPQPNAAPTLDSKPNFSIHLAPYLPLANLDTPLTIPASMIAFKYTPTDEIVAKYREIYFKSTTNLVLPR